MTPAQHSQNSPEDRLSQTLARQADGYVGTGLELDRVLHRAGEIRRGRRMRASMVMAAVVLAVAVPVGISALGNDPTAVRPPTPVGTPTAKADDSTPLSLDGAPKGDAPTSYAYAGTLYGGPAPRPLGKGDPLTAMARLQGGFLVARGGNDGSQVSFVGDDGNGPGTSWPISVPQFAVSPQENVGAFAEPDGTVIAVQDGGSRFFEIGKIPGDGVFTAIGMTGENCSGRSEEVGCTVTVVTDGEHPVTWTVSPNRAPVSSTRYLLPMGASVNGDTAGIVSSSAEGSCSEVRTSSDALVWKTCDYRFLGFSPDGAHLLASGAYGDGPGDGSVTVLDATDGKVALHLTTEPGTIIGGYTWEDESHALLLLFKGTESSVVRIGLDGSRETALAPVTGAEADVDSPYELAYRN